MVMLNKIIRKKEKQGRRWKENLYWKQNLLMFNKKSFLPFQSNLLGIYVGNV